VVVIVIMRTQARPAIVAATGSHSRGVECVDIGAAGGGNGVVPARPGLRTLGQPEVRLGATITTHFHAAGELDGDLIEQGYAQRRKGGVVKGLGLIPVRDKNSNVIKHGCYSSLRSGQLERVA